MDKQIETKIDEREWERKRKTMDLHILTCPSHLLHVPHLQINIIYWEVLEIYMETEPKSGPATPPPQKKKICLDVMGVWVYSEEGLRVRLAEGGSAQISLILSIKTYCYVSTFLSKSKNRKSLSQGFKKTILRKSKKQKPRNDVARKCSLDY